MSSNLVCPSLQFLLFLSPFLRQDDFLPEPGFQTDIWTEDSRGRAETLKAVASMKMLRLSYLRYNGQGSAFLGTKGSEFRTSTFPTNPGGANVGLGLRAELWVRDDDSAFNAFI